METVFREARERAVLVATGKDRLTWLNGLVTSDLAKARPGDAVYGLALGKTGRILADVVFVVDEASVLLVVPREARENLRAALEHYLIMEDVELAASEAPVLLVDGPGAKDALAAARSAGAVGGEVDGGAVVVGDAAGALEGAGAVRVIDEAWEASRIERGMPRFGADFDGTTYPQEASLEKRAVSFSKGCYLGQEVVCMLEMRGHVKRKLVTIAVDAAAPPARGAVVTDEAGAEVGQVTSAAVGPSSGRPVALAMVKRALAAEGRALRVGENAAKVVRA
jgi:folate-binding protein YgfZ